MASILEMYNKSPFSRIGEGLAKMKEKPIAELQAMETTNLTSMNSNFDDIMDMDITNVLNFHSNFGLIHIRPYTALLDLYSASDKQIIKINSQSNVLEFDSAYDDIVAIDATPNKTGIVISNYFKFHIVPDEQAAILGNIDNTPDKIGLDLIRVDATPEKTIPVELVEMETNPEKTIPVELVEMEINPVKNNSSRTC